MSPLSRDQSQLIFDYTLGIASLEESTQAEQLIQSNPNAANLHQQIKTALSPLESLQPERCPDELAEGTIFRLGTLAGSRRIGLEQLLADEQARQPAGIGGFWRNFAEVAAVAAVIVFAAVMSIPSLRAARQMAWQKNCQLQLARIAQGITQYAGDHGDNFPMVPVSAGAPWWKVGDQGTENHSNTRHLWLLVKGGYVEPRDFVCPGRSGGRAVTLHRSHVKDLSDFPSRRNVTYSFRIVRQENVKQLATGHKVLMADLSPVFERTCTDLWGRLPAGGESIGVRLCKELLNKNSTNHRGRGQNVMFADGSVEFRKRRAVGISLDDMFTLKGKDYYRGCERPASANDVFLAP